MIIKLKKLIYLRLILKVLSLMYFGLEEEIKKVKFFFLNIIMMICIKKIINTLMLEIVERKKFLKYYIKIKCLLEKLLNILV
ncbi:MAG: hypothetical protein CM1200mP5_3800 [Candidatus Pelagibacterales bacterium]|nr:MAG: hypothetical protein CM1200mP5_3800 [Pelagibacterales bacterium]